MIESERAHSTEPAEGDVTPGREVDFRTPHPQQPAEGEDLDEEPDEEPDKPETD